MKVLQSLLIGTTMAATTLATGTIAASPAQAMGLNGSIGLHGTAVFGNPTSASPASTTLGFTSNEIEDGQTSGDFLNVEYNPPAIQIQTLELSRDGGVGTTDYNFNQTETFINFGQQNLFGNGSQQLTFDLDAGSLTRMYGGQNFLIEATMNGITGNFNYGGETIAAGFFSASRSGPSNTYQMTLSAREVPEPLTILGTGLALGFGVMFKKKGSVNLK
ncbi:MAG: PEP-CTERM sorting domain-containing protein [Microcoleaceae cyanobacterium]